MSELVKIYEQSRPTFLDINYLELHKILITYNSTKMEGSTLDHNEATLLIQEGITPNKPLEHANMVVDHYEALSDVIERAKQKEMISEALIKTIGGMVKKRTGTVVNTISGSYDISKGEYRLSSEFANVQNEDGKVEARYYPDHSKVPSLMRQFCEDISVRLDAVSGIDNVYDLSFDAHYHLRRIHPFGDGNSRTSRLLMNYIQYYHGYAITPVKVEKRADYLAAIFASSEDDTGPIKKFMVAQAVQYMEEHVKEREKMKGKEMRFFV